MKKGSDVKKMLFKLFEKSNNLVSLNLSETLMTDRDCLQIVKSVQNNLKLHLDITDNGDETLDLLKPHYSGQYDDVFVSLETYDKILRLWKGDERNLHVSVEEGSFWDESEEEYLLESDTEDADDHW